MITIERTIHFGTTRRAGRDRPQSEKSPVFAGRTPRVSRLMALAIRFDQLIRDGAVKDQADLARLGEVSRARLTQIMNLLYLAPDIQEAILFLPATTQGRDAITECDLRPIATTKDWAQQRKLWRDLVERSGLEAKLGDVR